MSELSSSGSGLTMPKVTTFVNVMRGCTVCQTPHPAVMGADDITKCTGCGASVATVGEAVPVDFALGGFRGAYFNFLLWCIGKIARLIQHIERL